MTWWRQARDNAGMTISQRLGFDARQTEKELSAMDWSAKAWAKSYVKRLRSIVRRLSICPKCRGSRIIRDPIITRREG
jgi:hypothetical protein